MLKKIFSGRALVGILSLFVADNAFGAPSRTPSPPPIVVGEKVLDDIQAEITRFEEASKGFKGTVQHVVQQSYQERRKELQSRYEGAVKVEEAEEKKARLDAIALFEQFLVRYPNDTRWTPDVIFRLAELYFERSNDEYLAAAAKQQGADTQVVPDYTRTIELYKRLLLQFPDYRLIDGAYYLMGYCLGSMNKEAEAKQAYLALVCHNKYKAMDSPTEAKPSRGKGTTGDIYTGCSPLKDASRFLPEAWIRVGEYHFDYAQLDEAILAYAQVLQFKDSPYFDKALYKLAWSYYRADRYLDAIRRFDELVMFSDKQKGDSGREGSDLRAEAVQYLGVSFAEKDWNADGADDQESGLDRIENFYRARERASHVREIFMRLGDIYFDQTEYVKAAEIYKRVLSKWPYDKDSPKVQDRIILAFERMRNFDQALKEREALGRNYARGTEWYKKNRDNKEALATAQELAEASLVNAAVNRHKAAQEYKSLGLAKKDGRMLELAAKEYRLASDAYESYLRQYPQGKNAYEYGYYYAETLYYSQRFEEAARAYEKIRDSKVEGKYLEDAAFNAIKAYEMVVENQKKAGSLLEPPLPSAGQTRVPVQAIPIPELWQRLRASYDAFVEKVPNSGRVPTISYKAAEIDYRHLNFDSARNRMAQVVERYCKDDRAIDAGNAILVSYTIENNVEKLEEWTNRLKQKNCGSGTLAEQQQGSLKKLSEDVRFSKAQKLFDEKKYEEAATLYVQLVDSEPRGANADKALNNAAVAYENLQRYAAATRLYERIVNDYENSPFIDDALFRVAVNYQRFFEFDKAALAYQRLATDARFKNSKHRTNSLFNAAIILENDQNFAKSAELFKQYSAHPQVKEEEASDAFFRVALVTEKMKDYDRTIREFRNYIRKYGAKNQSKATEATYRIALALEGQRDKPAALDQYRRVIKVGSGLDASSEAMEYVAHSAFLLTEIELSQVEKMRIRGGGKALEASIREFEKVIADTTTSYRKIIDYKRARWTLAAYFRIGYLFELYAKALLNAPCPAEVKRLGAEACDLYRNQIEQKVSSVEDEAVKRYSTTLEQSSKLGVVNEWTKLARVKANAYRPDEFPITKEERVQVQLDQDKYQLIPSSQKGMSDPIPLTLEAISLLSKGRYEDAITMAKLALQRDEKYVPAMVALAKSYYMLKKMELASSVLDIAKAVDEKYGETYNVMGFVAISRDDRAGAIAAFKKATEVDRDLAIAHNNLCAQYILTKNYEQALSSCIKATNLSPDSSKAHLNMGSVLRGVKKYADAESAYRKSLTLQPTNAEAYFNLGILYLDAKDMQNVDLISRMNMAVQNFGRYKELSGGRIAKDDPVDQYIKEARDSIEREQKKQQRLKKQQERQQPKSPESEVK